MLLVFVLLVLFLSVLLIWKGSNWITDSLIPVAHKLGTSYIAVTTLLVSFMISTPEIFTTVYSYMQGHLNIGLGVIIGSVMINIGMTVGLSAAIKPLKVDKAVVLRDGIFLIIVAVIVLLFGSDLEYTRPEGIVLLLLFIPYVLNVWSSERMRSHKSRKEKVANLHKKLNLLSFLPLKLKASFFTFILGAIMLLGGSYLFSFSLVGLSNFLPFPDLIVGLLFGAIGTAVPNIAAAIQGTLRGYKDAAITETFGSNIFTLLITLGIVILLSPFTIAGKVFYFDLIWMIMLTFLMIAFIFKGYKYREESLTRFEGFALMIFYLVLLVINVFW